MGMIANDSRTPIIGHLKTGAQNKHTNTKFIAISPSFTNTIQAVFSGLNHSF